jgi:hypothetical protein
MHICVWLVHVAKTYYVVVLLFMTLWLVKLKLNVLRFQLAHFTRLCYIGPAHLQTRWAPETRQVQVRVWNFTHGCGCESSFSPESLSPWIRLLLHPTRTRPIVIPSWVEACVNSRFCQFLLGLFQICFEFGSNSIDFGSSLGFWSNYFPNWIPSSNSEISL